MNAALHPSVPVDSGICHVSNERIDLAADFIANTPWPDRPTPILPFIKATFDLNAIEAVQAIRAANRLRNGGADAKS